MPSFQNIRDRLAYLYRPEDNDRGLLTTWLRAVGTVMDRMSREADDVMRSHWYPYADLASFHPYFLKTRILQKADPLVPQPSDPVVRLFPYVQDLARLGMLLPVAPWEDPPALRESVEEYRLRIRRMVEVYSRGLGTLDALRAMVEAQLPANRAASSAEQADRPFWLEEFAPLGTSALHAPTRGEPDSLVGPLMRWTVNNGGVASAVPTIYIQGVAPQPDLIDSTNSPLVEFYEAGGRKIRVGIGYGGNLAPGQTLRLRPTGDCWLGMENGLQRSESLPDETHAADPTAPGPWSPVAGSPVGAISAICQTADRTLWVASNAVAAGSLQGFNGKVWTKGPGGLGAIHALFEDAQALLIGADTGLLRMPLYPAAGALTATPIAALAGHRVNAIFRAADGGLWLGCDNGAVRLNADDSVTSSPLQNTEVLAMAQDDTGVLYFGTALGLFEWQPAANAWHWFEGKGINEAGAQWRPFTGLPAGTQPFLPPVRRIWRGRDASLWLGTQNGIARYTATEAGWLEFEPRLEAFPDLGTGPVLDLREDARGLVWFATDRGLFRYDGRDMWQFRAGTWVQMGRADTLYPNVTDRGQWRFKRATSQWERFDANWVPFTLAPRSTAETRVNAIAWTTGVAADLGQWDGKAFSNPAAADASQLVVRYKPSEDRIVSGGLPGIPALPPGPSVWRYLSLEAAGTTAPADLPWWTREGRLIPPPVEPDAPGEGRYDVETPPPPSDFDESVFTYNPAAGVWFEWREQAALSVLVRLKKLSQGETIDPVVVKRAADGAQQVRPAGVRVAMAVEEAAVGA
jgi:hypothetical protein